MGRLYLLRHGQASLLEGDYDRLSPLGERQSRALGRWLAGRAPRPAALVSGTLRRQADTLRLLAEAAGGEAAAWRGLERRLDPDLDEYHHDDMLARTFPALAEPAALQARLRASAHPRREFQALFEHGLASWLRGDIELAGGLTWARFRERSMDAVRRAAAACGSGECVVAVTSGGTIAAICQALLGVPDAAVPQLHNAVFNASITSVLTRGPALGLSVFNSVSHLELEPGGEPLVTYR